MYWSSADREGEKRFFQKQKWSEPVHRHKGVGEQDLWKELQEVGTAGVQMHAGSGAEDGCRGEKRGQQ